VGYSTAHGLQSRSRCRRSSTYLGFRVATGLGCAGLLHKEHAGTIGNGRVNGTGMLGGTQTSSHHSGHLTRDWSGSPGIADRTQPAETEPETPPVVGPVPPSCPRRSSAPDRQCRHIRKHPAGARHSPTPRHSQRGLAVPRSGKNCCTSPSTQSEVLASSRELNDWESRPSDSPSGYSRGSIPIRSTGARILPHITQVAWLRR
jgi:hypothetical protein